MKLFLALLALISPGAALAIGLSLYFFDGNFWYPVAEVGKWILVFHNQSLFPFWFAFVMDTFILSIAVHLLIRALHLVQRVIEVIPILE